MFRTIEAVIDEEGVVRLLHGVKLPAPRRALLTILEEEPSKGPGETALPNESALAGDWDRPEEDIAWAHLQHAPPWQA